jgi:hypothetical protein
VNRIFVRFSPAVDDSDTFYDRLYIGRSLALITSMDADGILIAISLYKISEWLFVNRPPTKFVHYCCSYFGISLFVI